MSRMQCLALSVLLLAGCGTQLPQLADASLHYQMQDGYGEVLLPDGGYYRGEFKSGLLNGEGMLLWRNGMHYTGHFRRGVLFGEGVLHYPDGSFHRGNFVNGLAHGEGESVSQYGDRYIGGFIEDLPAGEMVVHYADGDRYEGRMAGWNLYQGPGLFTSANGDRYKGYFADGVAVGEFNVTLASGERYNGTLKEWQYHGEGEWHGSKGGHYIGAFKHGKFNGVGDYKNGQGGEYSGNFRGGLFHGDGKLILNHDDTPTVTMEGRWQYGRYVGIDAADYVETGLVKIDAASLLYRQPQQVMAALEKLAPDTPAKTDLYFVAFGSYGEQDVFKNEVQHASEVMQRLYRVGDYSVALINNRATLEQAPLATVKNLQVVLNGIAEKMNLDEDILFLYITSHGSREHEIDVSLGGIPFQGLTPELLRNLLDEAGIKWRVLLVSSCFSGGFIEPLKGAETMVMSAARADRASFGCGSDDDLTYFGRAFFEHALQPGRPFVETFELASERVTAIEHKEGLENSEPQIEAGAEILKKLTQWRATLDESLLSVSR